MAKAATPRAGDVPSGGMWERQRTFGGKRLQQEFAAEEEFILRGIQASGEIPASVLASESPVPKTTLTVSRMDSPEETFEVGTLSGPIAAMVPDARDEDFPVIAYWSTVPTDQPSEAVVLTAIGRYES